MTAALLFDLDGTLVETDHVHFEAFRQTFHTHGVAVDWELYKSRILGRSNALIAADFLPHVPAAERAAVMAGKEALYRAMLGAIEPAPGLVALLDWAHARGLPCGVVTNAPRLNAEKVLDALGLGPRFDTLVIGPELADAKPHPLPYRRGLEILGADAARSVAFEDSPSGAISAHAAGLAVVGLSTSFAPEDLRAVGADLVVRDYTDPALLAALARRTGVIA